MGNVQHIARFFDKKWQDRPYVLWKSAKKGLILRNTGLIVAGAIICLYIECIQIIEGFINKVGQASLLVIIMSGEDA